MLAIDIIIFALIAAFFFFKYRSIMGQPPQADEERLKNQQKNKSRPMAPPTYKIKTNQQPTPTISSADGPVSLDVQLKELAYIDAGFNEKKFLNGARAAFDMIINAYADSDKTTLQSLLSPTVYNGFVQAIDQRKEQGHRMEFSLEKITDADIIKILQDATTNTKQHIATITVEFKSEQISATYDQEDNLVDGEPDSIITPIDRWSFERDLLSDKPDWILVATESVAV